VYTGKEYLNSSEEEQPLPSAQPGAAVLATADSAGGSGVAADARESVRPMEASEVSQSSRPSTPPALVTAKGTMPQEASAPRFTGIVPQPSAGAGDSGHPAPVSQRPAPHNVRKYKTRGPGHSFSPEPVVAPVVPRVPAPGAQEGAQAGKPPLSTAQPVSAVAAAPEGHLSGDRNLQLACPFPEGRATRSIKITNGVLSEESWELLQLFNLKRQAGPLPAQVEKFSLVVKLVGYGQSERKNLFLCVTEQRRCQLLGVEAAITGIGRDQVNTWLAAYIEVTAPVLPETPVTLSLGTGVKANLIIGGAGGARLVGQRPIADLYWETLRFNWSAMPEVPHYFAQYSYKYPIILRYAKAGAPDLWVALGDAQHQIWGAVNGERILPVQLLELLQSGMSLVMVDASTPEIQAKLFKRDLMMKLEKEQDMSVVVQLLEDPRVTADSLYNFQSEERSLVSVLIDRWEDDRAEIVANIVETLQEIYPDVDWVGAGAGKATPLCLALDAGKVGIAQALLGIHHDNMTPASPQIPNSPQGLTILHYALYRTEPETFAKLFLPQDSAGRRSSNLAVSRLKGVIDAPDKTGMTPLMLAIQMQTFEYAQVLLDQGASLLMPGDKDIRHFAAAVSTKEVFDALLNHPRVQSELPVVGQPVVWQGVAGDRVGQAASCVQIFKRLDGKVLCVEYDVNTGMLTEQALRNLHCVNNAGTLLAQQEGFLRRYPVVILVVSNGRSYWMCADARGYVQMFNAVTSDDGAKRTAADYDGNCWGPNGTCVHVVRCGL